MSIKLRSAVVLVGTYFVTNASFAEPNKVLYELQERCGRQASETFKMEHGSNVTNTSEGQTVANYENHYNARLNKCFYLEIAMIFPRTKDRKMSTSLRLFDLHENREFGSYFRFDGGPVMQCAVDEKSCGTEQEWRALTKPFMED
jgi:hypothetical protein